MLLRSIAVILHAVGSVQSANVRNPVIDLGYAKYKGTHNSTSRLVERNQDFLSRVLC